MFQLLKIEMQYAAQVCLRSLPFLCLSVRYYNCVPFAGCVFVGPSKICQPRVKTFEELPLEMHPQKPPQVSFLSSYQLSENVNWLVTFSESFFRLRHYHLCLLLKMVILGRDRCSTCVNLCLFSSRTTRRTAGWFWPPKNLRELSTTTGVLSWKG